MRRQNDRLIQDGIAFGANRRDNRSEGVDVLGSGEITHVLKHQELGVPGPDDFHDVEEERSACFIFYSMLLP